MGNIILKLESDQSYATQNNQYPDHKYREDEVKNCTCHVDVCTSECLCFCHREENA